jgi:multicomponent Na+:H+ antiporter subunit B
MRRVALIMAILLGLLLLRGTADFPKFGDPQSPASTHLSNRYISEAYHTTHVYNMVSAILADYRNFDTMFETTVVFTAGTSIFLILRLPLGGLARRRSKAEVAPKLSPVPRDPILEMACRVLFPPIQLFGFYVLTHGHYSPGGGFQAGVILGASFILLAIGFDLKASLSRMPEALFKPLSALGVAFYIGLGFLCLLLGGEFLNYEALRSIAPFLGPEDIRSEGILLVECGVTLTVGAVIFWIYTNLVSRGTNEEGL